ncbi:ABC transporter substrate-binding protein [Dactylosporangium sp. CS-033363]|uniref:ABC transporter substrate-binding protein n=1 Tax=Dactylosporangium sp. CS-033363 TaxID=3239935 RepID=UPI003D8B9535
MAQLPNLKLLAGVTTLAAALAVSGCASRSGTGPGAASADKAITWYTTIQASDAQPVMDAFQKKTGIKVSLYTAATPTVWQRLQAEESSNRHIADVLSITSASITAEATQKGYLATLPASVTTGYPAGFADTAGKWFAMRVTVVGLAYNTKTTTGDNVPKSWTDLFKPYFKDGITQSDATVSTGGYLSDWQLSHGAPPLDESFLTKFAATAPFLDAHSGTQVSAVVSGAKKIAIVPDDAAWAEQAKGAPIAIAYPTEGAVNFHDFNSVLQNAPNKAGAEQFAAFLASSEGQALIGKSGTYVVQPDVKPVPEGRPALASLKLLDPQLEAAAAGQKEFLAKLVELKLATKA